METIAKVPAFRFCQFILTYTFAHTKIYAPLVRSILQIRKPSYLRKSQPNFHRGEHNQKLDTWPYQPEEYLPDYISNSSMDTTSSFQSQSIGMELEYDGRLHFHMENTQGAKIHKIFLQCYAVKVEDHPSNVNPAPWVNFEGDQFMGRDGSMYLLIENPEDVDQLGNPTPREEKLIEENPPITNRPRLRPINSIWVRRVLIDDNTRSSTNRRRQGLSFIT